MAVCMCICYVSDGFSDADLEKMKVVAGLELVQPTDVGVFHYEQSSRDTAMCAVLSNHGTRVWSSSSSSSSLTKTFFRNCVIRKLIFMRSVCKHKQTNFRSGIDPL